MTILTLIDGTSVEVTDDQLCELRNLYGDALRRTPRREIFRHIYMRVS